MPCPNERRKRNMTIAFRVTPEENDLVNLLAKTANMTKQEYIMSKLTDTTIVVQPSTRTFKALKDAIAKVGTVKNLAHFSDSLISPPSGAATPPAESRPDSASSPTRSRPRT